MSSWYSTLQPGGTEKSRTEVEYTISVQRYFLDSITLLTALSRQKRSGTLYADHASISGIGGDVSISIVFEQGVVRGCQLLRKQKLILYGKNAYKAVEELSALEWIWTPCTAFQAQLPPPLTVASSVEKSSGDYPQQTAEAQNKDLLRRLSRRHRQVLSLCDGTRALNKIAAILSISPQALSPLMHDLKGWGCIRFRQEF